MQAPRSSGHRAIPEAGLPPLQGLAVWAVQAARSVVAPWVPPPAALLALHPLQPLQLVVRVVRVVRVVLLAAQLQRRPCGHRYDHRVLHSALPPLALLVPPLAPQLPRCDPRWVPIALQLLPHAASSRWDWDARAAPLLRHPSWASWAQQLQRILQRVLQVVVACLRQRRRLPVWVAQAQHGLAQPLQHDQAQPAAQQLSRVPRQQQQQRGRLMAATQ